MVSVRRLRRSPAPGQRCGEGDVRPDRAGLDEAEQAEPDGEENVSQKESVHVPLSASTIGTR
jgi:hypothetical protein